MTLHDDPFRLFRDVVGGNPAIAGGTDRKNKDGITRPDCLGQQVPSAMPKRIIPVTILRPFPCTSALPA